LVDIIYGGFPCQDISLAGIGKGLGGKRSGLFFEIMRLAKEIEPSFIFLENVPAITSRGLNMVASEITSLRYDCRWGMLSASEVGAHHKRERWFLLAKSTSPRLQSRTGQTLRRQKETEQSKRLCCSVSDSDRYGLRLKQAQDGGQKRKESAKPRNNGKEKPLADSIRLQESWETEPSVGRVVNGLPGRVDRIKSLGNAVVPAQVCEAFERLVGLTEFGFLK
jgi:DNA (cytosine-5)-methyltransferase 1